ncbi:hypothetical protein J8273_1449 [Carpediemonas membranifera]|uniref:Adhesin domain-containing protein n=1 Tax=Carpediemonas membranifera TaxID=201153 RepID=A0A8J6B644_9EUKA|nr:hypothetical protein J8273_1449 [Carpediemonas membranifera]|eukprot:KAG9396468.1 hypothetical protein J8273_1449 [Carpediemonas membranifera]
MNVKHYNEDNENFLDPDNVMEGLIGTRRSKKRGRKLGLVLCCCCSCCCCLCNLLVLLCICMIVCWVRSGVMDNYDDPFAYSFTGAGLTNNATVNLTVTNPYGEFVLKTGPSGENSNLDVTYSVQCNYLLSFLAFIPDTRTEVGTDDSVHVTIDTQKWSTRLLQNFMCLRISIFVTVPEYHPIGELYVSNPTGEMHISTGMTNGADSVKLRTSTCKIQVHNLRANDLDCHSLRGDIVLAETGIDGYTVTNGIVANNLTLTTETGSVKVWNAVCDTVGGCLDVDWPYEASTQLGVLKWEFDDSISDANSVPSIKNVVKSTSTDLFVDEIVSINGLASIFQNHTFYLHTENVPWLSITGGPEVTVPADQDVYYIADKSYEKYGCFKSTETECEALTKVIYASTAYRRLALTLRKE